MNLMFKQTDENGRVYIADYFHYSTEALSLAPAATATRNIQIEADADFVWVKAALWADVAGAAQTTSSIVIPLVTVAITDSGSGRNLQNRPIPIALLAGDLGLPYNNSVPRKFAANSNITVTFTNESAATTYANLRLVFQGFKRFYE